MENEYQLWEKVFSDFSKQAKSLRKENRESVLEGIKENDKNAWEELMVYYLPSLVQIYQKEVPESICEEVPFDEYIIKFQEKFYQRIHHGQIDNRYLYLELSKSAKSVIQHIKKERKKESKIRVEDIMEMDKHPKYATMMELVPDLEEVLNQNLKTEYVSILCEYFGIQTKPLSIKELAHKYQLKEGKIQSMVNAGIAALRTKKVFTEVLEAYGYTPDEISKRKQDMKYFTKKSSALKEQNMGTYIYHPA
ncbi:MAG: hypothetical protein KH135_04650, partial [Firmicutes bacterium]|nr:hypothetical protein [Bacillota bacterium]